MYDIENDELAQGDTVSATMKGKYGGVREGVGRKSCGKSVAKFIKSMCLIGEEFECFKENLGDGELWVDYLWCLFRQDVRV